ncbi:MAG: porin family protein [Gemmatimonadaceae bacterium]|nr:porin family protein [Gemmatimonadaceae bacterium]
MHPVLVRSTRAAFAAAALCIPALVTAQQSSTPAAPASEPSQAGTLELGVFGQYNILSQSRTDFTSNTPTTLGLRAHVGIGSGLGLEFEGSQASVTQRSTRRDLSYNQLAARATFTSAPILGRTSVVFGAGIVRSDYEYTFRYGPTGMLGLRLPVGKRFAVRADALVNLLPSTGDTEVGFRAGLHTILGPDAGPTAADRKTGNRTVQGPGAIEIGGFLGYTVHAVDYNIDPSGMGGGRVGVFLTSRSQLEFEFGLAVPDIRDEPLQNPGARPNDGADYNYTPLTLRYNYNVPVGKNGGGVIVGAGLLRSDYGWVHYWGPSGLIGYRLPLWNNLSARGDLVTNWLPTPGAVDLSARLGVSWTLPGK